MRVLPEESVPHGLESRILARVVIEQRRLLVRARLWSAAFSVSSIVLVVVAVQSVTHASSSGFYQFLLLLISDRDMFVVAWQSLALALIESAPILGIASGLAAPALALFAVRRFIRYEPIPHH